MLKPITIAETFLLPWEARPFCDGYNKAVADLQGPPIDDTERLEYLERALAWHHQQLADIQRELGERAPDHVATTVRRFAEREGPMAAMKEYRRLTGSGLRVAHDAVTSILKGQ